MASGTYKTLEVTIMTKRTLITKLNNAVTTIKNGKALYKRTLIKKIQFVIGTIEDGECYDDFEWDEDAIPNYMADCIVGSCKEEIALYRIPRLIKSYIAESRFEGTKMSIKDFVLYLRNAE